MYAYMCTLHICRKLYKCHIYIMHKYLHIHTRRCVPTYIVYDSMSVWARVCVSPQAFKW